MGRGSGRRALTHGINQAPCRTRPRGRSLQRQATSETEALADRFDLRAALDQLPAEDREAFLLVHHYGYSSFEAAALLGVPASTVRSRVARARQRLAEALSAEQVRAHDTGWPVMRHNTGRPVTTQEGEPV